MKLRRVFLSVISFLCIAAAASPAQQYTIKNIVFDGTVSYAQADLQTACGLKPGDVITSDSLGQAAQRLIDTGAFDDVEATLGDGPYKAITVIFKVVPDKTSEMLSVGFANFVWWQPDELAAELRKRVPLFNGTLPEGGNLQNAVSDALEQMLGEKQIPAVVTSRISEASVGHPMRTLEFRIASPDIRIRSFNIQRSVALPLSSQVDALLASFAGMSYNDGITADSVTNRVLRVYRDVGYLDAALTDVHRTITADKPDSYAVDLSGTLQLGELYHVATIEWPGSSVFSAQQFTAAVKLHPGDLASQQAVQDALLPIETAYLRQGYLDIILAPNPQPDPDTHQVSYTITATPGDQYSFAAVTTNLPPAVDAQFQAAWKLPSGSIYDGTYLKSFLQANIAQPYMGPYTMSYKIVRNPVTHLVTINMTFLKR